MQDENSSEKRSTPARLVIVDYHHLLRRGFRSLLTGEPASPNAIRTISDRAKGESPFSGLRDVWTVHLGQP